MLTPQEHSRLHALYPAKYQTIVVMAAKIGTSKSALHRIMGEPASAVRVHPRTAWLIREFLKRESRAKRAA